MAGKNGNGKGRATGSWTLEIGKVVAPVKMYTTAKEKDDRADFNQFHSHDGGRVRYKKVCEICRTELPAEGIVKGKLIGDKLVSFTEEELDNFKKAKDKKIKAVRMKPKEQFTDDMFGKSYYVGTADKPQPFKLIHDALAEYPEHVLQVTWIDRGHDHHGVLSVYKNAMLIREIVPKHLHKDFSGIAVQDAEVPAALVKKFIDKLKPMIDTGPFNHGEIVDDYPETVDKVMGMKLMGEEIPVAELPQKKAEADELADMLED